MLGKCMFFDVSTTNEIVGVVYNAGKYNRHTNQCYVESSIKIDICIVWNIRNGIL